VADFGLQGFPPAPDGVDKLDHIPMPDWATIIREQRSEH
jgi:hypothetical protein